MLPPSLTKRLIDRGRRRGVTEDHADGWTHEQLRDGVRRIADGLDEGIQTDALAFKVL